MELTEKQQQAFQDAREKATELMTALYRIRYSFYEGQKIPVNGHGVWTHVPDAQGRLESIRTLIDKAEAEALK